MPKFDKELDVFIKGESVNLCIPTAEFAATSDWYNWMNDPTLTKYLKHGLFPNTAEDQVKFFEVERQKRLILIVQHKGLYVGVVSLSQIDFIAREVGNMAMVISNKIAGRSTPWVSLETIAFITIHAMETMGMNRINSGQHHNLARWQNRKEILGYRLEGVFQDGFVKGHETVPVLKSSILLKDYLKIKDIRGGRYWDGLEKMKLRLKKLPEQTLLKRMYKFYDESEDYYDQIFNL